MNTDTKRHIDSARQVLVGVVPNPSAQIDQITNALIYKFMDDMDQSVIKIGGKPTFFTGDLEKYAWVRIMDSRIGAQERMNLYDGALLKFSQAKQLPPLFRDIFKLAVLPYRSPEVLDMFLKEINYFSYSHSENLGDAFEYLLSVMSSQGDAGMFRTPRHIIKFIVDVVNPTKDDKILDPACGTAGFLISAYKHILEQHDGKDDPRKIEKPLTPEQKKALTNNFIGYDISPEMVRLSRVNMYLHNFKDPQIIAYNTLADEERWNDKFDVILANPPFMSPKGAGKPHSKFSIQSSRSEVLFVDYIMNHLRPKGRAGIIVPEGIIFQSGKSHKELRNNLVNDGLYAVVSLPSGVFNPYAGVKTSILLFNNELAKTSKEILFVKIEQDGFDLGATKRPISKNDLPIALEILNKWNTGEKVENKLAVYVEKSKIAENGDYNLSGDRYRIVTDYANAKWPFIAIEELCNLGRGRVISKKDMELNHGPFPVFSSQTTDNGTFGYLGSYDFDGEYVTWTTDGANAGTVFYRSGKFNCTNVCGTLKAKTKNINMHFLAKALNAVAYKYVIQVGNPKLMNNVVAKIKIPLPPLEIQEQVVADLDGYAGIIAGAKQIVQSWKPKIDVDPEWKKVKLEDVCNFENGKAHEEFIKENGKYVVVNSKFVASDGQIRKYSDKLLSPLIIGDVVMVMSDVPNGGAIAKCFAVDKNELYTLNQRIGLFRPKNPEILDKSFLYLQLNRNPYLLEYDNHQSQTNLRKNEILDCPFFLPKIKIQKQIVEKIEAEHALVKSAKKLIEIYEQKTKEAIAKLWSE
jgi:type I restriction enzyme M protein